MLWSTQEQLDCLQLILQRNKPDRLFTQKKQLQETPFSPNKFNHLSRSEQKIIFKICKILK